MNAKYAVDIIESEAGWGQRIDETMYFDSKDAADKFVEKYNSKNNLPQTPSWYMRADPPYLVDLDARKK
jgi:hypothetical protein